MAILRTILDKRMKDILVMIGWAIIVASVVLQALYQRWSLTGLDMVLLFIVSVLAGMVLVDPEVIVLSYAGSIFMSVLIMFVCLTLPATLGMLTYVVLEQLLYSEALSTIVKSLIPIPIILCLMGGLIGGFIGEELGLR